MSLMIGILTSTLSSFSILVFSVLLGVVLISSPVVEFSLPSRLSGRFRYYSLPILVLICIARPKTHPILSLTMSLFMNTLTQYMFFYRPFQWTDGSVARFMWLCVCYENWSVAYA